MPDMLHNFGNKLHYSHIINLYLNKSRFPKNVKVLNCSILNP